MCNGRHVTFIFSYSCHFVIYDYVKFWYLPLYALCRNYYIYNKQEKRRKKKPKAKFIRVFNVPPDEKFSNYSSRRSDTTNNTKSKQNIQQSKESENIKQEYDYIVLFFSFFVAVVLFISLVVEVRDFFCLVSKKETLTHSVTY